MQWLRCKIYVLCVVTMFTRAQALGLKGFEVHVGESDMVMFLLHVCTEKLLTLGQWGVGA